VAKNEKRLKITAQQRDRIAGLLKSIEQINAQRRRFEQRLTDHCLMVAAGEGLSDSQLDGWNFALSEDGSALVFSAPEKQEPLSLQEKNQ